MNPNHPVRILDVKLREIRNVSSDAVEVDFELPEAGFSFDPGQYIRVTLPHMEIHDSRGPHRDFSISSAPDNAQKGIISVTFRDSDSGFKKTIRSMSPGDPVRIAGPFGSFGLPDSDERPIVCIAGGMGIAPFMSMIRNLIAQNDTRYRISLLYGNRSIETAAFLPELKRHTKRLPHVKLHTIFGFIDEAAIRKHIDLLMTSLWFIAGPPEMTTAIHDTLIRMGIPAQNIKTELFTGYMSTRGEGGDTFPQTVSAETASRAILDALNKIALVGQTDVEGTLTYVNDKFVEISKYSREELIGQNHRILKSGAHPDSFYKKLWDTISGGEVWRGEIKNRAKDGSFYWVDSGLAPIFGENKKIVGYIAARFPITERKKIEEKLAIEFSRVSETNRVLTETKERLTKTLSESKILAAVVRNTSQAFGMSDIDGNMVDVNDAFVALLGYGREELLHMKYIDLVADESKNVILSAVQKGREKETTVSTEAVFKRKDGTAVDISLSVNFYAEEGHLTYIYAFLTDITETKKREKADKAQLHELEQINEIMVGRELRMIDLKKEIRDLRALLHHDD